MLKAELMSDNALIIGELVHLVQTIVNESGDPANFDAHTWVLEWIKMPLGALGGKRPCDFFSTVDGQILIKNILRSIQDGTYL